MKISLGTASALLSFCSIAGFVLPAAAGDAESLAAAEKAFAAEGRSKGTRSAFLNVLAKDSIVFEPGPQNGPLVWKAKEESPGLLEWQPVLAATATKGDLGYTTGPWSYKDKKTDEKPSAYGEFVSIWRWENDKWKMVLDLGSHHPAPTSPPPALQLVDNHAPQQAPELALPVLMVLDKAYGAERAKKIAEVAEDDVRLYLPNEFPITEKEAAVAALARAQEKIILGGGMGAVSQSGDLGYIWGSYQAGSAPDLAGYYLHIWRKDRAGEWKLALDLLHPR